MKAVGRPQKWTKMCRSGRKSVGARYRFHWKMKKVYIDALLRCIFNFTIYRRCLLIAKTKAWSKSKWNEIFAKPSFEATSKLQFVIYRRCLLIAKMKAWSKFKCEAVIWNSIEASICVENSKKSRHLSLVSVIKKEVSWNFKKIDEIKSKPQRPGNKWAHQKFWKKFIVFLSIFHYLS